MPQINTILFDLDGTLIDSRMHIIKSVNYMLKKLGLPIKSTQEITSFIGTGVNDLLLGAMGNANKNRLAEAAKLFKENYHQQFLKETALQPHAVEILDHFGSKEKIIVTNASRENAEFSISRLGIKKYFTAIIGGDDEFCLKPTSCPVNKALGRLNKKTAIIVGDMAVDVLAGKDAGILTCAVTNGIGRRTDLEKAGPDFLITDLLELKNIIY